MCVEIFLSENNKDRLKDYKKPKTNNQKAGKGRDSVWLCDHEQWLGWDVIVLLYTRVIRKSDSEIKTTKNKTKLKWRSQLADITELDNIK